ncbi:50S ribosomal protein L31 [Shewanella sp. OPT22]|uniref:50S ribosomal protein L31 n=1 Tax=Parashewanella hymeniacidonis TaxID=2807618 RepID=UPI001020CD41|nr:50S ribosomal protein L31 [Parashewanella hymeniacidonis]MBM7073232.1 50S ribosomal protein L31 [Parashewanella hymeniacidonis]RYV03476.1 50S ribosomal protein L31 [Shewanella sp. OPT22]
MKQGIHPDYEEITATCTCGNNIKVKSTVGKNLHLDVCGACHPFYTGTQKVVDTGGRIDKFNKRFGALSSKK